LSSKAGASCVIASWSSLNIRQASARAAASETTEGFDDEPYDKRDRRADNEDHEGDAHHQQEQQNGLVNERGKPVHGIRDATANYA